MRVTITVHQETYPEKPTNYQCSQIRKPEQNTLQTVDVYQLAKLVARKHSFYLGEHNLHDPAQPDLSRATFLQQQAFAVDVDHGNFMLEEIQERLSSLPFKPCLIYKTYSYEEPYHRRWRIVFFADRFYTDPNDVTQINEYLIYVMAHDFREHDAEWFKEIDTKATDCARIYFGGTGIALLQDVPPANFEFIFDDEIEEKVRFFKDDLKKAKKELKKGVEGAGGNNYTQDALGTLRESENGQKELVLAEANDPKALAQKIIENLETLSLILPNKPQVVDYYDCYDFINQLPLAMLLGVSVGQKFNCVLPHHQDADPSAHILWSLDGKQQQVYHCFGCMDPSDVHRTFSVVAHIFEAAFGYTIKETLESIYTLLEIQLGSRYQQQVQKQLLHDVQWLEKLDPEDPFNRLLTRRNIKGFYKAFLMLGMSKVSFASMKKDPKSPDLVFFASNSYLHDYLRTEWNLKGIANLSSVNKKINYLVRIGLLSKIAYEELSDSMLTRLEGYITQTKEREEAQMGKSYKRNPDYYQINFLTPDVIQRALTTEAYEKKHIARSVGQGKAQVTAMHGSARGKEIYRQSKEGLLPNEQRFVKLSAKAAWQLLRQKSYFTEEELLKKVDPKGNYWKKAEKVHLSQKLLPYLARSFQLEKKRVSKALREQFNIPAKVTSYHHVIYTTTTEKEWDLSILS